MSVQPVSPIRLLCEELPNVYVFSARKMFTTFCAPFLNRIFQDPGDPLGLCALFIADTNSREPCVSRSLKVGNIFLILSYSKLQQQKCLSCSAISHSDAVFF